VPVHLGVDVPDERRLFRIGEIACTEELRGCDEGRERLVLGEAAFTVCWLLKNLSSRLAMTFSLRP